MRKITIARGGALSPYSGLGSTHSALIQRLNSGLIEGYELGDKIEVFFNISSREYQNRYYHNIDAWKITHTNLNESKDNTQQSEAPQTEDSLPF